MAGDEFRERILPALCIEWEEVVRRRVCQVEERASLYARNVREKRCVPAPSPTEKSFNDR